MKITMGQDIRTSDGEVGEVDDVVIDPGRNVVTHLVVQPHHRHWQARLVPIDVVASDGDGLALSVDAEGLRAYRQVAESDFVAFATPIDLGDDWDVGIEQVLVMPSESEMYGIAPVDAWGAESVQYDRIPHGECEIRRSSAVRVADRDTVGDVAGFVLDDGHVVEVIVRTGMIGFRHLTTVGIGRVTRVRNDVIDLDMTKEEFDGLPERHDLDLDHDSAPHRLEGLLSRLTHPVRTARSSSGRDDR